MAGDDRPPELVAQLRQAIEASGQSLNQLSQVCGVDRGRLSRFMRGERDLTLFAAGRLCEVLGLKLHAAPAIESVKPATPAPPPAEALETVAKRPYRRSRKEPRR